MVFFGFRRLCVPNVDGLRERILEEAHSSRYSIHLGATNMYRDLRQHYWWWRMKKDIVEYVVRCLNRQQVKLTKSAHFIPVATTYTAESTIQLDESLGYEEEPVAIIDRQDLQLRSKRISAVKVQWRVQLVEEVTWEPEEDMRSRYPHLFGSSDTFLCLFEDEHLFKRWRM
ncbi:uncharacterized protein [Nicotiana sylvestris]|uniref:uncharacterized protein n=1 Tax=Nicotiana sylvestris TaxID=4096 RepID=UPI00388C34EC